MIFPPTTAAGTDWSVLTRLFAKEPGSFRHHMGVYRSEARTFYAPTAEAAAIQNEKQRILEGANSEKYSLSSAPGVVMLGEFFRLAGIDGGQEEARLGTGLSDREWTLRLEPDLVLVSAPRWEICWASVCFPSRWSLEGKRFRALADVHDAVPGLNEEFERKIDVFFTRLVPGEGWGRANWGLSGSQTRNQHPSLPTIPLNQETPLDAVWVRVESQHLLKLPESGGIAFGIRVLNFSLAEVLVWSPEVASGLREQLRTMPVEVAAYKGVPVDFWRRW